ncbi:acetyl-coenzyme A synthetase, cytoplasmic-like isoform X1 [Lethenteron reissneri]|uniref:acetyl-coenzyme A synthetase, cytoplasmic-like isoform X1 n=1 Tax=Lethenteron reissneri TaxID=7753 RepID=UPI002AB74DAF|nr:acetyl-coenzyme A synthetase, cytoplasmic-like isoform X1 [Lethenteron reissneri]
MSGSAGAEKKAVAAAAADDGADVDARVAAVAVGGGAAAVVVAADDGVHDADGVDGDDGGDRVWEPPPRVREGAHIPDMKSYQETYRRSVTQPQEYWAEVAKDFHWETLPTGPSLEYNFDPGQGPVSIKWMKGATTNACYNVLDLNVHRHKLGDKVAFYWEGNEPGDCSQITYKELLDQVCKCSNVLLSHGVGKGDRVAIYMPMITELVVAMLACARIGAVHSIVFAGFSSDSLSERILDSKCCMLITADGFYRGQKLVNLKEIANEALQKCIDRGRHVVERCIVVRHLGCDSENGKEESVGAQPSGGGGKETKGKCKAGSHSPQPKRPCPGLQQVSPAQSDSKNTPRGRHCVRQQTPWQAGRDVWWHVEMAVASTDCPPVWCDAEDPLFILYTSGSTGKPKGVLHTVGGYVVYAAHTHKLVFDLRPDDVYWCTADIGWITGHSYITYGPLANGATSILFEGLPTYPDQSRCWQVVEKYGVTKFYTAPTAIRLLMKYKDEDVFKHNVSSLKVLGTVGEPINPEAWRWYHRVVGGGHCPIVDTFWQTETGGHVLTPLPGATPLKPGSATLPFFGVVPAILNEHGEELHGEAEGYLVFKQPWPGMMRSVYGDHQRFEATYFQKFPGFYVTGDGCRRDKDGYYWITGRIDDMLNVSGHLLSTAEVESALVSHASVAEAAVVSAPHPVKGESLYCFVSLKEGQQFSGDLVKELKQQVREKIGPIATPDYIQNAPGLPKTRSGKIMRRILRKIARNDTKFDDTSTLADPAVIDSLLALRCAVVQ